MKRNLETFTKARAIKLLKKIGIPQDLLDDPNTVIAPHVYINPTGSRALIRIPSYYETNKQGQYIGIVFKDFVKSAPYSYNFNLSFIDVFIINRKVIEPNKMVNLTNYVHESILTPRNVGSDWAEYVDLEEDKPLISEKEIKALEKEKPDSQSEQENNLSKESVADLLAEIKDVYEKVQDIGININLNITFKLETNG